MAHQSSEPHSARDDATDSDTLGGLLPSISDNDIADAMRAIPGYLDITPQDFRELYLASAGHYMERLAGHPTAGSLMRAGGPGLRPAQSLAEAVAEMAAADVKSAAVVDDSQRVMGILTERDVLKHLGAPSILALLARAVHEPALVGRCCAGALVAAAMTSPAETIDAEAKLAAMTGGFARHQGRAMPVVDASGRLLGMLARKDLIGACGLRALAQAGRPAPTPDPRTD